LGALLSSARFQRSGVAELAVQASPEERTPGEGDGNATGEKHIQDCIALFRTLIFLYDFGCRCRSCVNGDKYLCSSIYARKIDPSSVDICADYHGNHIRCCLYPAGVFNLKVPGEISECEQ
jgi:hypothetical protein